jgi:phosphatidylglycerophosphatase A
MLQHRDQIILWLAQGFGTGRAPKAPGTVGTLPGVVICLLLAPAGWPIYCAVTLILLVIGIPLCDRAAQLLGRDDPPSVVWDEIVGYLISMILLPIEPLFLGCAFLLFRFFDILKPWPICWLDRELPGGLGIMLDDVAAGLMALAVAHLGLWLIN